jgi:MoaA/NifB/PqqE/SkfB family radical SAM enzyme
MNRDLTKQLTVFVTTIGAPQFEDCLNALGKQTVTFTGPVIVRDVAPMSAAFQVSLDTCKTPYFAQIDEDMILNPFALGRLYDGIESAGEKAAIYVLPLHDVHLDMPIIGVKVFRLGICKNYPYEDQQSAEMGQIKKMEADGFSVVVKWDSPVGKHGTSYTPRQAYERYCDLAVKSRRMPWFQWVNPKMTALYERAVTEKTTPVDMFALMGYAAGLAAPHSDTGEKDFRSSNTAPGLRDLDAHVPTTRPYELVAYLTSRCMLSCSMCYRARPDAPVSRLDLSPALLEAVLDLNPTIKSACLAGLGEPLLSPFLQEILAICKRRGLYHSIITNGVLLADMLRDGLDISGLGYLGISINRPNRKSYNDHSGLDAFADVISGIDLARLRCPVMLSAVVGNDGLDYLTGLIELAAQHREGTHPATLALINVLPHNMEYYFKNVLRDQSKIVDAISRAKDRAAALGVSVVAWPVLRPATLQPLRRCRSPWECITLDGDGHIGGCRCLLPPWELGDTMSFKVDVWTGPALTAMRRKANGADLESPCHECFRSW